MQGRATRAIHSASAFVRWAEFEILFLMLFLIAFLIVKDLGTGTGTGILPFQDVTSRVARFINTLSLSGDQMSNVGKDRKTVQGRIYMLDQRTDSVAH